MGWLLTLAMGSALLGQFLFVGPLQHWLAGLLLYTVAGVAFWQMLRCAHYDITNYPYYSERCCHGSGATMTHENNTVILRQSRSIAPDAELHITQGQPRHVCGWELLAVAAFTVLGFALRILRLDAIPTLLAGDEAAIGLEALKVLDGSLRNMFVTGWFSHPTMFFFVQAFFLRFFGTTVFALRLSSALAGTLTIPVLYALVRRWWGFRVALSAAALLSVYPFHVHFSRLGLNNVEDALFSVLVFYALCRALQGRRALDFAACGLLLGLSQYFYWGCRALPLVVGVLAGWTAWKEKGFGHLSRRHWLLLGVAFLLTVSPLAVFFVQHPQEFIARYQQISILSSDWLERTAKQTGQSVWALLGQQIVRSGLAFHALPDSGVLYAAPIPLLDYLAAVLFTFGLFYILYHRQRWPHVLLLVWLGLVLVLGSVLLVDPPASQRLVGLAPLLCLLPALGLDRLLALAHNSWHWGSSLRTVAWLLVLMGMLLGSVRFYFWQYTPGGFFLEANSELVDRAGRYLRNLGPEYYVYFAGAPRVYWDAPAIAFLAPGMQGQDVLEPITTTSPWIATVSKAVFLFTPERAKELAWVRSHYPGGRVKEFRSSRYGLLFLSYELS